VIFARACSHGFPTWSSFEYAGEDLSSPRDVGAEFVHVGFARPFNNLGRMRQVVAAWTGKRMEVTLDAGLYASPSRLSVAARTFDGRVARLERGAE
jgi:hypothetical protein